MPTEYKFLLPPVLLVSVAALLDTYGCPYKIVSRLFSLSVLWAIINMCYVGIAYNYWR